MHKRWIKGMSKIIIQSCFWTFLTLLSKKQYVSLCLKIIIRFFAGHEAWVDILNHIVIQYFQGGIMADFFQKCQALRKGNRKNISPIYNEFSHIRFFELYKNYENTYQQVQEDDQIIHNERSQLIALGCFSQFQQFERSQKDDVRKERLQKLTDVAQELAQEKTIKKVETLNLIGQIKRMVAFHNNLLQESETAMN